MDSLLALLTLEEKIGLIAPDPSLGSTCFAHIHGIPRVGLPEYGWLVEMNTGVASECLGPDQCATTFVGPTGLGAAFNREMWAAKGDVLSTEMRAFANARWYRGTGAGYPGHPSSKPAHIGTSAFGPNLNMIRDPRYGRNSELPGEDPFHTGSYGVAFVTAMQTPDAAGHPRVSAYLKHFDAYATETNRMHSDNNITAFDFWDTYLPQYKMVFTEAKAAGAMCSYQAENGSPSCANSWLLNDVLRKQWKREDAYITTDCGAVRNVMGPPLNLSTQEEAAAATINAGTDLGVKETPLPFPPQFPDDETHDAFAKTGFRQNVRSNLKQAGWRFSRRDGHDDLERIDGVSGLAGLGHRRDGHHRRASRADAALCARRFRPGGSAAAAPATTGCVQHDDACPHGYYWVLPAGHAAPAPWRGCDTREMPADVLR